MRLAGLPTTKGKVIQRATSEGWPFEEEKGIGGTRRLYEIPAKYLPDSSQEKLPNAPGSESENAVGKVVGTIVAGQTKVDPELMALVVQTLEETLQERRIVIPPERKGPLIAVLYDYLSKGASKEEVALLLKSVG